MSWRDKIVKWLRNPLNLLGTVVTTWFVVGLFVWLCFRDPANAGQFGDTFGFTNSLAASLSLVFVVWSLYEQREANAKANELAKKTTILQSMTEMAGFCATMMERVNTPQSTAIYRNLATQYTEHARKLITELGGPDLPVRILTKHDEGADELEEIMTAFMVDMHDAQNIEEAKRHEPQLIRHALMRLDNLCSSFQRRYNGILITAYLDKIREFIAADSTMTAIVQRPEQVENQIIEWIKREIELARGAEGGY